MDLVKYLVYTYILGMYNSLTSDHSPRDLLSPCSDYDKDESGAISAAEMRDFLNGVGEFRAAKTVDITGWIGS